MPLAKQLASQLQAYNAGQSQLGPPPPTSDVQPLAQLPVLPPSTPHVVGPDAGQQEINYDQAKLQKVRMAEARPWGFKGAGPSAEFPQGLARNHPGTMGHIAHALSVAGNIAGNIVAPSVMANIPGTQLNMKEKEGGIAQTLNADLASESTNHARDAATANTLQETAAAPGREAAQEDLQDATTKHLGAETQAMVDQGPSLAAGYAHAVNQAMKEGRDPATDPIVSHLADAITSIQKQTAAKVPTTNDRAVELYAKPPAQRTPEEQAFLNGYEHNVKVTKTDPGVARTQVLLQMPQAISDPNNPGGEIYTTRRGAIGQGAPGGAQTQVPLKTEESFTSGKNASTLTNFNTARSHLEMLGHAADALKNNDVQLLNKVAQGFATQTGSPAPTNFEAIKGAVSGEIAKTFKGGEATDSEIAQLNHAISSAQSPQQLRGAIQMYSGLMDSKVNALKEQYQGGVGGRPSFGGGNNQPSGKVDFVWDGKKLVPSGSK